jgi:8-oxo-dGTP pyrophosphatase MutT (NUDIX family)
MSDPEKRPPPVVKRGVVAIAKRRGLFLAIRRGLTVAAGGRVCFPGGHIEPGEAEHEAVVRECQEELSLSVTARECVWRSVTAWGTSLAWWTVTLEDEVEPLPHPVEVAEIFWLSADELLAEPALLDGNREFLLAAREGVIRL